MLKKIIAYFVLICVAISCNKQQSLYEDNFLNNKITLSNYKTFSFDELYHYLLYTLQYTENYKLAKPKINYLEETALKSSDSLFIYRSNNLQLIADQNEGNLEHRFLTLFKSINYFEKQKLPYDSFVTNCIIAEYYFRHQNYQLAENYAYIALGKLSSETNNYNYEKAYTLILLSNIHLQQGKYKESLNNLETYISLVDNLNFKLIDTIKFNLLKSTYINNFAIIKYLQHKKSVEATIEECITAFKLMQSTNSFRARIKNLDILNNIISLKIKSNDNKDLNYYVNIFNSNKSFIESTPLLQVNLSTIGDYFRFVNNEQKSTYNYDKKLLKKNKEIFKNIYLEKRILEQFIRTDSNSIALYNHYLEVLNKIEKQNNFFVSSNQKIIYENLDLVSRNKKLKREIIFVVIVVVCITIASILLIYTVIQRKILKKLRLNNSYIEQDTQALEMTLTYKNDIENKLNKNKQKIIMELHDNIVNKLFSTRFLLHENYINPESIVNAKHTINEVKSSLMNICDNYNEINELYEKDSFHHLLIDLIAKQPTHQIQFTYNLDSSIEWFKINPKIRFHLYRILQELLQNIHKHSSANRAVINLSHEKNILKMIVFDNGVGFKDEHKKGIGLQNILNRLKEINGDLKIETEAKTTFIVSIEL